MPPEQNTWVEYRNLVLAELKSLSSKSDDVGASIHSIEKILDRQASQLEDHIKRTEIAEESISLINSRLADIEKQRWLVSIIFRAVIGGAGALVGVIELVKFIKDKGGG